MPEKSMCVAVWNLQDFGSAGKSYARRKGANSALLADFVARVCDERSVDILFVLEIFKTARAHLQVLLDALNGRFMQADWCFDWVKGSLRNALADTPPGSVDSNDKLTWKSSRLTKARSEGYAVFWRDDQRDRFRMREADLPMSQGSDADPEYLKTPPAHAISLTLWGRVCGETGTRLPYVEVNHGFVRAQPTLNWAPSEYPDVSRYAVPYAPGWTRVRRPAYVVVELNVAGDNAQKMLPILGYHAPSGKNRAMTGTYLSGCARELYVLPAGGTHYFHEKTIAGGDYNLTADGSDTWARYYRTYWEPFALAVDQLGSGAACEEYANDPDHSDPTIVKLRDGHRGPPIERDHLKWYLGNPIDNIFARGLRDATTEVVRLPYEVMENGGFSGDAVQAWLPSLVAAENHARREGGLVDRWRGPTWIDHKAKEYYAYPNMTRWDRFRAGVERGFFDGDPATGAGDARSAAVFVHDFISDHLPVLLTFTIDTVG